MKQITQLHNDWENAKKHFIFDGFYHSLFKSIKSIKIDDNATFLLPKLPIDILFDSTKSNLTQLEISHYWNNFDFLQPYLNDFKKQYLSFKTKMNQNGKNIKKLSIVKHLDCHKLTSVNICIDTKHLYFNSSVTINLSNIDILYPISILTCKRGMNCNFTNTYTRTITAKTNNNYNYKNKSINQNGNYLIVVKYESKH